MSERKDANSTIAYSIYNLLASAGHPIKKSEILQTLRTIQHPTLSMRQFEDALMLLCTKKKLLVILKKDFYDVVDKDKGIILRRDISDARRNTITREWEGGWNGWVFKNDALRLGGNG